MEKYVIVLLLVAAGTVQGSKKKCQEITIPMCKGIGYNYTYMPNQFNHDTQEEAGLEVHQFWPLVKILCSPDLRFFLCSMYAPICMENYKHHLPSCRSVCIRARDGCAPLMRRYGFVWPARMDCDQLPVYGESELCMDRNITDRGSVEQSTRNPSKTTNAPTDIDKTGGNSGTGTGGGDSDLFPGVNTNPDLFPTDDIDFQNPADWNKYLKNMGLDDLNDIYKTAVKTGTCCKCNLQPVPETSSYYNKITTGGYKNCAMNCTSPYFNDEERNFANFWIGLWSILCCISTAMTLLTFFIDMTRFKYPERPIIFLSGCYFMVSIGYIIKLVVGHSEVACEENRIRYATTGPAACVSTFLLIYFFGMASSIWWVILSFTWFLSAGLKWGSEAIASYSQYFHIAAWLIPSVKTIVVLAISGVDGDSVAGICYVGNQDLNNLRGFVLIPLLVYLVIGSAFLILGFVSLFRIRNVIKNQNGGKIEKLERLMIRIGVFSLLYTIPATIVLACYFYEQHLRKQWETSLTCSCLGKTVKPDFAVFMLKYFMCLVVGITSGFWVWTGKTVDSWKKLCNVLICCKSSDYAYSRPPIKYSPTSASAVSSLHKPLPISHC